MSTTPTPPAPPIGTPTYFRKTDFLTQVKQILGPVEFARRNRYVAYSFGGNRGPRRIFWDNA